MTDLDNSLPSQLLRKASADKSVVIAFTEVEFLAEPWLWLYAMVTRKPHRDCFVDELEVPGRWAVAFQNGILQEYGAIASALEVSELTRAFAGVSREYFAWQALGSSEAESRRLMRAVEPTILCARAILDELDARIIGASVGKNYADDFKRNAQAAQLRLSRRSSGILSGVMKLKKADAGPVIGAAAKSTADANATSTASAAATASLLNTSDNALGGLQRVPGAAPDRSDSGSPGKKKRPSKKARAKRKAKENASKREPVEPPKKMPVKLPAKENKRAPTKKDRP